jgi:hypothetical protein
MVPRVSAANPFSYARGDQYSIAVQHLRGTRKCFHHKGTERTKVFLCGEINSVWLQLEAAL